MSDISEELSDHLIDLFKSLPRAMQIDEATGAVKDAHLITYVS